MSDDLAAQVERDLLADSAARPGGLTAWNHLTDRQRRRWIERFVRAERRRPALETRLADEPGLMEQWATFSPTEQREALSTLDYLRWWPLTGWEWRRLVDAVRKMWAEYAAAARFER